MSVLFITKYPVLGTGPNICWMKEKSLGVPPGEQPSEQFKCHNGQVSTLNTHTSFFTKNGPSQHDCPSSSLYCPSNAFGYFKDQMYSQRTKNCCIKGTQKNETQACRQYVNNRKHNFPQWALRRGQHSREHASFNILVYMSVSLLDSHNTILCIYPKEMHKKRMPDNSVNEKNRKQKDMI